MTQTGRPAALDGLLAHIARRINQIEAGTHAGHDSSTAQDGAANGTQIAVDSRSEPDAAPTMCEHPQVPSEAEEQTGATNG